MQAGTTIPRRAFTLMELLVVIAIIAILAALLFPAFSRAKQKAQGAPCLGIGNQMMTGVLMYTGDNNDFFPPNPDDGNTPWHTVGKSSDNRTPGPSGLWVLLDEDARDLNDAAFAFGMDGPQWFDIPGTYHNYGCGFAFADGHSETHQWQYKSPKQGQGAAITAPADLLDWQWMWVRTSAQCEPE